MEKWRVMLSFVFAEYDIFPSCFWENVSEAGEKEKVISALKHANTIEELRQIVNTYC